MGQYETSINFLKLFMALQLAMISFRACIATTVRSVGERIGVVQETPKNDTTILEGVDGIEMKTVKRKSKRKSGGVESKAKNAGGSKNGQSSKFYEIEDLNEAKKEFERELTQFTSNRKKGVVTVTVGKCTGNKGKSEESQKN